MAQYQYFILFDLRFCLSLGHVLGFVSYKTKQALRARFTPLIWVTRNKGFTFRQISVDQLETA